MSYKVGLDIKKAESPAKVSQLVDIIALLSVSGFLLYAAFTAGRADAYLSMIR